MTIQEIIDGLKMTCDLFLFNPSTGEKLTKNQLNDLDRTAVEACEGAIKRLEVDRGIADIIKGMRDATPEERKSVDEYIASISSTVETCEDCGR